LVLAATPAEMLGGVAPNRQLAHILQQLAVLVVQVERRPASMADAVAVLATA
jgi:hypothetical protein